MSFLFSYILYLKIYCLYVYVRQELLGHKDIEQNLNASPSAVSSNTGYVPTQHLRHIAHVCVWGRFCSRRPYFITLSLGGISLRSLHLGAFDFQNGHFGNHVLKQILEEGSRHLF